MTGQHRLTIRQQCGLAIKPVHIHEYDPTQPDSFFQTVIVADKAVTIDWRKHRVFSEAASLEDSYYHSFEKPVLQDVVRECDACVLVYSCSNGYCFERLRTAWDDISGHKRLDKPMWTIHNKVDMESRYHEVTLDEGRRWAQHIGATFRTMSTKSGENTDGFGHEVASRCLDK